MATLQELQDRLETLRRVRGTGTRSVTFTDGRQVVYRSDEELAAQIADLERQIAAASAQPVRQILISSTKGFNR